MEFPRLVYKSASEYHLVDTIEGFRLSLNEGWFASVPEATTEIILEQYNDDQPPTRQELEIKAKELDIRFTKKTTDEQLSAMINSALTEE